MLRALISLLALAVVGCTIVVFSALLANVHWALDLIGQFQLPALWALMLCTLTLILLLPFSRDRSTNIVFALFALIFAGLGWFFLWPQTQPAAADQTPAITVYQHNVWARNPEPERLIEALLDRDADIVALAEVEDYAFAPFEDQLKDRWPHRVQRSTGEFRGTRLRLLSKFEITDQSLAPASDIAPAILKAELATPEGALTVFVVHFTRPWPFDDPDAQLRQLAGLRAEADRIDGPLVMLGDFNSAPWGRLSERLGASGFTTANDPRFGTWPARVPHRPDLPSVDLPSQLAIPIDLAFCGPGIHCDNHAVGPALGSDHRSATFSIKFRREDDG